MLWSARSGRLDHGAAPRNSVAAASSHACAHNLTWPLNASLLVAAPVVMIGGLIHGADVTRLLAVALAWLVVLAAESLLLGPVTPTATGEARTSASDTPSGSRSTGPHHCDAAGKHRCEEQPSPPPQELTHHVPRPDGVQQILDAEDVRVDRRS